MEAVEIKWWLVGNDRGQVCTALNEFGIPCATLQGSVGEPLAKHISSKFKYSLVFSLDLSTFGARKLLGTRASLLGARTLLVAPGLTTSNKKLRT